LHRAKGQSKNVVPRKKPGTRHSRGEEKKEKKDKPGNHHNPPEKKQNLRSAEPTEIKKASEKGDPTKAA